MTARTKAPAAVLTGRLALLLAEIRRVRGPWNGSRVVRFYRRPGTPVDLPDTKVRAVARGDLRDLAAWGYIALRGEQNNRFYTLTTRKDGGS
ncbi:hypothetical protein [Streptomyces kaempferi]|uniref:Uncharacterized protein n=1 Tax=Streptomyces kaempferi TaxID=333725 RepID=A0ABW3XS31_9ACTN